MNFIFDIGNVLINFKPAEFLESIICEKAGRDKMLKVIFGSKEWIELDKGNLMHADALKVFLKREPEFEQEILKTMAVLKDMLTPIEKTIALLPQIKAKGHKLYYLSNFHKELREYVQTKYSFFEYFDGGVFSCDVHEVKPDPFIYDFILKKYSLNPSECIFIDDVKENIKAAKKKGIKGIVFTCTDEIKKLF